jgi:hypothetical protein
VLYAEFGINIFDFAEANDFLLAAFKEPVAFGMAILTVIGGVLATRVISRIQRSSSSNNVRAVSLILVSFVVYTFAPAYFFARLNAREIRDDSLAHVRLRYLGGVSSSEFRNRELILIGTTEKFSFFYDKATQNRLVIPIDKIGSILYFSEE